MDYVEVDGQKFVDDGTGSPKLDDNSQPIPFVEEKAVPYHRFQEVNTQLKTLEKEITALKEGKKEGTLSDEQQKELQAKTYLKGLLKETLEEQEKSKNQIEQEEMSKFKEDVSEVLAIHTDIKKDDFLKFLETDGDDYASVASAMKSYKRINELSTEAAKVKNKDGKPGLPTHEGGGGQTYDHEKDKGKSLWQIAEEAQRELVKK